MRGATTLKGRVAVIMGATSAIGLALASQAAKAGMKVALADADERMLAETLGHIEAMDVETIIVRTDISDVSAVRMLARRAETALGPPWLVCNYAPPIWPGPVRELTPTHLKWAIEVNLWRVIDGVQVFAPDLIKRGAGHIVNIASLHTFGIPGTAAYVAATHAIVGLSESLYRELDMLGSQVGVTVVCPALVHTSSTSAVHDRSGVPDTERTVCSGAPSGRDIAPNGLSPDNLAEQIFAAVAERRFWLLPCAPRNCEGDTLTAQDGCTNETLPTERYGLETPKPVTNLCNAQ